MNQHASAKESKSEVWKFYLSGDAEFNHAPFPAEVIAPKNGATTSPGAIELSWKVSDVDTGDTHTFDIFLDKVDAATRIKESLSATKTSVDLGTGVYYWSITATDSKNNKSQSGTHMFTVK